LHLGSLLTALASFLEARRQAGSWLLRIDDLDTTRVDAESEARILRQLEAHGLQWDELPRRQSEHLDEYADALSALDRRELVYACGCTRAVLAQNSLPGPDGSVYNGACRQRHLPAEGHSLRLHMPDQSLQFVDASQGTQSRRLDVDLGDFVLRRRDGIFGYQLACAVDEHAQRITEVVRGADLLSSTFFQIHLMHQLRLQVPHYRHLPVLAGTGERKLSKQNHARAIEESRAAENLHLCLDLLGQNPAPALRRARVSELIAWAQAHWRVENVPRRPMLVINTL
jgi:glutamyl-Q tRNA(Asp) synthetase